MVKHVGTDGYVRQKGTVTKGKRGDRPPFFSWHQCRGTRESTILNTSSSMNGLRPPCQALTWVRKTKRKIQDYMIKHLHFLDYFRNNGQILGGTGRLGRKAVLGSLLGGSLNCAQVKLSLSTVYQGRPMTCCLSPRYSLKTDTRNSQRRA